ncbi:unnamed protein product [Prorocentrum cordatum]|uniref:Uncharacterized protein n=1 Tax=Prorocentrum cordatum TaxID=2364126 RepID=A0ABN9R305_9DINO|nr:unnamed protein product [Polarella glacialis]
MDALEAVLARSAGRRKQLNAAAAEFIPSGGRWVLLPQPAALPDVVHVGVRCTCGAVAFTSVQEPAAEGCRLPRMPLAEGPAGMAAQALAEGGGTVRAPTGDGCPAAVAAGASQAAVPVDGASHGATPSGLVPGGFGTSPICSPVCSSGISEKMWRARSEISRTWLGPPLLEARRQAMVLERIPFLSSRCALLNFLVLPLYALFHVFFRRWE